MRRVASQAGSTGRPAQGSILFLGLALLLAIAATALAAAYTTTLELRMARYTQDAAQALHAAEAALAETRAWLDVNDGDPSGRFTRDGRNGLYTSVRYGEREPWRERAAWSEHGRVAGTGVPGIAEQPRVLVEWIAAFEDAGTPAKPEPLVTIDLFRITVRSTGASPTTVVRLQGTHARIRDGGGARRQATGRLSWVELPPW